MTTHEEQDERVVLLRRLRRDGLAEDRPEVVEFPAAASALAAQVIGHAPGRHLDQPCAWIVRKTFVRPLLRGGEQRFLHRIFGDTEVSEAPDHRAENLRRHLAQQVLVSEPILRARHTSTGGALMTSRTSIGM